MRTGAGSRTAWFGRVWPPALGVALVIAVWQTTVALNELPSVVLPTVPAVAETFVEMLGEATFWSGLGVSLVEFALGFVIGTGAGVLTGLVLSAMPRLALALAPVIETLRFIVPFAWIPLTILWFGTSITGKVFLVAYAVYFVLVVSTLDAVRGVDPILIRAATMLGMSRWQTMFRIHFRAATATILSSARAAAGIGWIAVVAAEYVGSNAGLGYMIIGASSSLDTALVIAAMIVIGLVGALVSWIIGRLARASTAHEA